MAAAIADDTRVVWIANPNNPTGTMVPADRLEAFLRRVPERVIVVIDEAYNEYLHANLRAPTVPWLRRHPNLVITRTFSKAYGLAGLRVGYALAHPSVADLMNRVRQPFNVNSLALVAATAALDDMEFVARSYAENLQGMRQLEEGARRFAGMLLSTPQFMLSGVPSRDQDVAAIPVFAVPGTDTESLCNVHAPLILGDKFPWSCSADGLKLR